MKILQFFLSYWKVTENFMRNSMILFGLQKAFQIDDTSLLTQLLQAIAKKVSKFITQIKYRNWQKQNWQNYGEKCGKRG